MKSARELVVRTAKGFYEARALTMASSISYYILATMAPLGVLALWIGGLVLGPGAADNGIAAVLEVLLGSKLGAEMVALVGAQSHKDVHQIAGFIAILFLLYGAGSLFLALQRALDAVWMVRMSPRTDLALHVALRALVVFAIVFLPAVIVIIATISRSAFIIVASVTPFAAPLGERAFVFLGAWLIVALLFATLPDASVGWKSLAIGSFFTASTWALGSWAFGLYLSRATLSTRFGAAGSLVLFLVWILIVAQLFLGGARMAYEHARLEGRPVRPRPWAEAYQSVEKESRT